MDLYSAVKLVHVLSAALLIGVGAGTAFFLWYVHRSGETGAIRVATSAALLVEWWIIIPTVVLQPLTGLWMLDIDGQAVQQPWIIAALLLFGVAGLAWVPAVALKVRLRNFARAARGGPLPATYRTSLHWWFALWWTIFLLTLAILALMVFQPSL